MRIVLLLAVSLLTVQAVAQSHVSFGISSTVQLDGNATSMDVNIPVTVTKIKREEVLVSGPHPRSVFLADRFDKSFTDAVQILDAGIGTSLRLRIDVNKLPETGDYKAEIVFLTGKAPDQAEEPLLLTIKRPAHRISSLWLLVPVLLGLLIGFLVRQVLERRKILAGQRATALALMRQIRDAFSRIKDPAFHNEIAEEEKKLNKAITDSRSGFALFNDQDNNLITVTQATTTAFNTALANHLQRMSSFRTMAAPYMSYFNGNVLDAFTLSQLPESKQAYIALLTALEHNDPERAGMEMAVLKKQLSHEGSAYCQKLLDAVQALKETLLPKAVFDLVQPSITKMLQSIETGLQSPANADDPAGISNLDNIFFNLGLLLNRYVSEAERIFRKDLNLIKDPTQRETFESQWQAWKAMMTVFKARLSVDQAVADALIKTWKDARRAFSIQGDDFKTLSVPDQPTFIRQVVGTVAPPMLPRPADPLTVSVEANLEAWTQAQTIQLLVYALVIGLTLYLALSPTYLGNIPDNIRIFLIAFSLDITAQKVLSLAPTAPKPA